MRADLFIIIGPTAAGKTRYAIRLARRLCGAGEIISADSMQVYKGMNIGTAKPTKKEMCGIVHHLISIKNPDEEWNVSLFVDETHRLIEDIRRRGKIPIIVGGTGLYIWTLLEGFSFPIAPSSPQIRARLEKRTPAQLWAQLKRTDPPAAAKIHPNDKKRIIRALEVFALTGKRISELQKERKFHTCVQYDARPYTPFRLGPKLAPASRGSNSRSLAPGAYWPRLMSSSQIIFLNPPREKLYKKIETRVDQMIKKGLVKEVKRLLKKGYAKNLNAFQALGYKEIIDYLEEKRSLPDAIALIKKRTRHFAKRQMVWFKRFKNARIIKNI